MMTQIALTVIQTQRQNDNDDDDTNSHNSCRINENFPDSDDEKAGNFPLTLMPVSL